MKYSYLLSAVLVLLFSCDKEDPLPVQTPEEVVKEEISEAIASVDDLQEFAVAFKNVTLQAEEVENGLTVFAPQDGSSGGRLKQGSSVSELSPDVLRRHMVKGLVDAVNLEDGDTLVALDGNKLYVRVEGDNVWINGVLISGKDLVRQAKYIIHKVEQIIEDAEEEQTEEPEDEYASLTIVVRNSVKWSPSNLSGEPEAGVTVRLYASPRDYFDAKPVAEGVTDSEGKVTFADATPETSYYVVAEKGALSSIFNAAPNNIDSVYFGLIADGIFNSQAEIEEHAAQSGASLGNFKWRDLNGDGIINNDDRGVIPQEEIMAAAGAEAEITVFIGYVNNDAMIVRDGPDALGTLQLARAMVNAMHQTRVMMDGILSDESSCPDLTDWCMIDNFTFTPTHARVFKIWNDGYNAIRELNVILRDVPALSFAEKDMVLLQAKGLRAYVYMELAKYYGGIPIVQISLADEDTRATTNEVFQFVEAELEAVANAAPAAPTAERHLITADVARALLARLALLQGDYARASVLASQILDGGNYSLAGTRDDAFATAANAEILWDFSSSLTTEFQNYFYGRTISPAIRLAEVYLILAEAQLELGDVMESRTPLSVIRARGGMSDAQGMTQAELRPELRDTWNTEMSREGNRFRNLVRWNLVESVLSGNGYVAGKHALLPIPMVVIDTYYNIYQNPGY